MPKRIKIGDIVEIPTRKGLAYAQYSNRHLGKEGRNAYGPLIRILPGFFQSRPKDFSSLANQKELYVTFFPLAAAVNQKIFEIVGNVPVPEFAKEFPLFRSGVVDPKIGKVRLWWFWDGEKEWKVGKINKEERKLPLREIPDDILLIRRIEEGWTPETDPF